MKRLLRKLLRKPIVRVSISILLIVLIVFGSAFGASASTSVTIDTNAQNIKAGDVFLYTVRTSWLSGESGELTIDLDYRLSWTTIGSQTCRGVPGNTQRQLCAGNGVLGPGLVWVYARVKPSADTSPLVTTVVYKNSSAVSVLDYATESAFHSHVRK